MKYFKLDYQKNLFVIRSQPLQVIIFILAIIFIFASVDLDAQDISKTISSKGNAELITGIKTMGSYNVGFKLKEFTDHTRNYNKKPRNLKMLVWYPSNQIEKGIERMNIGDYLLNTIPKEINTERDSSTYKEYKSYMMDKLGNDFDEKIWYSTLKKEVNAYEDIAMIADDFPMVVYTHGNPGYPFENHELCEFLASHGYIVLGITGLGTNSEFVDNSINSIEAQARDIEVMISEVTKIFEQRISNVFLIGFSWGGLTNVITAMRAEQVDGLITLDGAVTSKAYYQTLQEHFDYKINGYSKPTLIFTSGKAYYNHEAFFDELIYADRCMIKVLPFSHSRFRSMANLIAGRTNQLCQNQYDHSIFEVYYSVSNYILSFLNHYTSTHLKTTFFEVNVDENILQSRSKKAKKMFPENDNFIKYIQVNGIDEAVLLYAKVKIENPDIVLFNEKIMNSYGYYYINNNQFENSIKIFTLLTTEYPKSANAFDSLGDAFLVVGNIEMAIKNYENSLKLNPKNSNTVKKMTELIKHDFAK